MRQRKAREYRLQESLEKHEDSLYDLLRKEWEEIERSEKRRRLLEGSREVAAGIAKGILVLLALAGICTAAAVAPNMVALCDRRGRRYRFFQRNEFRKATRYLQRKKFIHYKRYSRSPILTVTPTGKRRALLLSYQQLSLPKVSQWDRRWRLVFFDVPEKQKGARDDFRKKLREMGFYQLQKSVFVSPVPCREEIQFLTNLFSLSSHVYFAEVDQISNEEHLRKHFELS